nr:hypothetical protein [uncultured Desulfobacter sp.]
MKWSNFGGCVNIGIILLCTVMVSASFAGGVPLSKEGRIQDYRVGKQQDGAFTSKADIVYRKDAWRLNVYITQKGSRSQGSHGILLKNGKQVNGKNGEALETAIGTLQYKGPFGMRAHLWDNTGWVMVHALVKPEGSNQIEPGLVIPNQGRLEKDFQQFNRSRQ